MHNTYGCLAGMGNTYGCRPYGGQYMWLSCWKWTIRVTVVLMVDSICGCLAGSAQYV